MFGQFQQQPREQFAGQFVRQAGRDHARESRVAVLDDRRLTACTGLRDVTVFIPRVAPGGIRFQERKTSAPTKRFLWVSTVHAGRSPGAFDTRTDTSRSARVYPYGALLSVINASFGILSTRPSDTAET